MKGECSTRKVIKPACLITWPLHLDYPVCRYNLERFKDYFSSIWIAFSNHHQEIDLSNFIRAQLPFANFVEVERTRDDWRDDSVNTLVDKTQNERYLLFLEQDFLIKDHTFFDKVFKEDLDFICYKEEGRTHPSFALVKRELVDKTSKCFAVSLPGDHFYKFFQELPEGVNIDTLGVINKEDYYHMAGLSQNYQCFKYGDPFFHPNNFLYFNWKSLQLPVKKHPLFNGIEQSIENTYGHCPKHIFLNKFFPIC